MQVDKRVSLLWVRENKVHAVVVHQHDAFM